MELHKKIIELLENNRFSVNDVEQNGESGYYVELNQSTPEGEDWWVTITYDGTDEDFIREFKTYADYFDVDEEVEIWVDSRGKNGVPSSIRALVEDAEWKEETLKDTAEELDALDLEFYALLEKVKPLPNDDTILLATYKVAMEDTLRDFLDKCEEQGCFDKNTCVALYNAFKQGYINKHNLYIDGYNLHEIMLTDFYDKVGLTKEKCDLFEQLDLDEIDDYEK